jgi:predicted HicB family RNase H-like nuclease
MNVLNYKGYSARVEFESEDRTFIGHIAAINDVIGFHGESVRELEDAFHEAVDDYLETCSKAGKSPEKPYSGKVMFRVAPATHARAALAAQLRGISLNQWAEETIHRQAEADLVPA